MGLALAGILAGVGTFLLIGLGLVWAARARSQQLLEAPHGAHLRPRQDLSATRSS